jgi:transmembrane sensor
MTQEDFQDILKRYQQGTVNSGERKMVEAWYASIGKNEPASFDHSALESFYLESLKAHVGNSKSSVKSTKKQIFLYPLYKIGIAASVAFILATLAYFQWSKPQVGTTDAPSSVTKAGMKYIFNDKKVALKLSLPEGSQITLQPQGKVSFKESFTETNREVFLTGEAFFEVSRDVNRPFLVYTNEITTRVLGTSFMIRALADQQDIIVAVRTGKVSVYKRDQKQPADSAETLLTPNQQMVFNRSENKLSRTLVEIPQPILSEKEIQSMHFEEASVKEVMEALEKIYGVAIQFDENTFSTCSLTTSVSDRGIYDRLDIICKAIGATYKVEDTQIILSGTGCHE